MAYLHKKFKKLASVESQSKENEPHLSSEPVKTASAHNDDTGSTLLKHSVGSMVAPVSPVIHPGHDTRHSPGPSDISDNRHRNKPSVLDKHIRSHINSYPCESCKFSFKTKSNLYKHFKSRSHILRVEKGIESSGADILAELGDTARDELDTPAAAVILRPGEHFPGYIGDHAPPPQLAHPLPLLPESGLVLLPSHLVKPGHDQPRHPSYPGPSPPGHYNLFPQSQPHPGLRFLEPGALPLVNGHHIVPAGDQAPPDTAFTLHGHPRAPVTLVRHSRPERSSDKLPEATGYPHYVGVSPSYGHKDIRDSRQHHYDVQHDRLSRDTRDSRDSQPDNNKKSSSHLNAESLEQRINKVISENQAIVETLDPFWKGRYMRQSSREDPSNKDRSRRFSQTTASIEEQLPQHPVVVDTSRLQQQQQQQQKSQPNVTNCYRETNLSVAASSVSTNFISNNVSQPPRPDSNIPLNLSDSGRKRKSPENPLIDAHSVKEVWLNSQKKTGNISHLEDIASKIEAKLRSSENPFHPDNPEGSIIKDLLLKTRGGHIIVAGSGAREHDIREIRDREHITVLESPRNISDNAAPINLQVSPTNKSGDLTRNSVGIPIPKNFLPSSHSKPVGNVETSLYQCNLCMVTFKSLESIEIHQSHYCKNTKHPVNEVLRPNSTVTHQSARDQVTRSSPSSGDRRKAADTGLSPGEPPVKRSRSESFSAPANVTLTMSNSGLLQIAATAANHLYTKTPGQVITVMSSGAPGPNVTASQLPGVPTPNLVSGILTGIKSQPMFTLPGVRADVASLRPETVKTVPAGASGVYTVTNTPDDKPVTFVLGIPGPHSQHLPIMPTQTLVNGSRSAIPLKIETSTVSVSTVIAGNMEHNFVKPPVSGLAPVAMLTSPGPRDRTGGHRQVFNSPQQRKYEFPGSSKLESPLRPLDTIVTQEIPPTSPANTRDMTRDHKPERPDTLALPPGALFKENKVSISGATLVSPETPRPKKAYVLTYQNGTAYTFLGLKCSTKTFWTIHKPQPNYIQLEKNSRVSMYSNWKVVAKDSHPSGLTPKMGMSAYNTVNHSSLYGISSMAVPKKSLMITTHSSRWHEKKATCHPNISHVTVEEKKTQSTAEVHILLCKV